MTARSILLLVGAVGALLAVDGIYNREVGRREERSAIAKKARDDSLKYNAEQLRTNADLLAAQHRATVAELARDSILRAQRDLTRKRVKIVSDSQVAIAVLKDSAGVAVVDSVGPTVNVPKEVVSLITTDDRLVTQDSISGRVQAAENQTLYRRDTLHVEGEHLRDEEIAETKPPRCGRGCGFVAGATIALAATHPKQTVQVVRAIGSGIGWIIRHVH